LRLLILGLAGADTLCRSLAPIGYDVTGFFARYVNLGDFGKGQARADFDEPYRLRSGRVWPVWPYPYSRWVAGLAKTIRQSDPQVALYVGEPSELAAAQSLLMVRKLAPQARLGVSVFENIERHWRGKLKWLRGRAETAVLGQLDFGTCASEGAVERLVSLGVPAERCRVVYPQINTNIFRPVDATEVRIKHGLQDSMVVGFAGRIVWEKGLDLLVAAIAGLPEHYRLLLVGSGRYLNSLQAQIETLGIAGRVVHIDFVPLEQVPTYLCAMDMLVLPSRSIPTWQEQYGRILPQAMLCKVPVIGSDSGAIPEVISEAGLVFRQEDVGSLREAINRLGDDEALRLSMAQAGLERAQRTFVNTYGTQMAEWLAQAASMPLRVASAH